MMKLFILIFAIAMVKLETNPILCELEEGKVQDFMDELYIACEQIVCRLQDESWNSEMTNYYYPVHKRVAIDA